MSARFITFEGIEGCGKTTQVAAAQTFLESKGYDVLVVREPGGTAIGEQIRNILLSPSHAEMAPVTELMLYAAARAQLVAEQILPALHRGTVVLCDRFADSTTAYQGGGRALPAEEIARLNQIATQGVWPGLTILFDLPAEQGLARASRNGKRDRIEREALAFHQRVRERYLTLAHEDNARVRIVDARQTVDAVARQVCELLEKTVTDR